MCTVSFAYRVGDSIAHKDPYLWDGLRTITMMTNDRVYYDWHHDGRATQHQMGHFRVKELLHQENFIIIPRYPSQVRLPEGV